MKKDKIIGIVLALISILFLYMTWALPQSKYSTLVGPAVFPYMAAGGLLLCALALLLKKDKPSEKRRDGRFLDKAGWLRVAKLLGLLILFPIMFNLAGFIISAMVFLFLMILMFDLEKEVPLWKKAAVAIVVSLVLYFLFVYMLKIQLPRGVIFG